jgi:hypothetical protein
LSEITHSSIFKTFFKGTIALAIFSIFLQVNSGTVIDFLSFVGIYYLFLGFYMFQKRSNSYILGRDGVEFQSFLRAPRLVKYPDIDSIAVSQGFLAKRFDCGTVYLNLRHHGGRIKILGGGSAEAIRDVKSPALVRNEIENKIGAPPSSSSLV